MTIIEESRDWSQENERNEQQAGVDGVVGPELGFGQEPRLLKVGELSDDDGEKGVVSQGAEELAQQQEWVVALEVEHSMEGVRRVQRAEPSRV